MSHRNCGLFIEMYIYFNNILNKNVLPYISNVVTLAALDRAAKQPIRKTVNESGESILELNCSCNEQN